MPVAKKAKISEEIPVKTVEEKQSAAETELVRKKPTTRKPTTKKPAVKKPVAEAQPAKEPPAKSPPPKRVLVRAVGKNRIIINGFYVYPGELREVHWAHYLETLALHPNSLEVRLEPGGKWLATPPKQYL